MNAQSIAASNPDIERIVNENLPDRLVAEATDGAEWPEPMPLIVKLAAEAYPLDALPLTVRAAVTEVQGFTLAPIALVASSALGALSLSIQGLVDVKRVEGLYGPVSLFVLTVADSGERKSTCDQFFTAEIRENPKTASRNRQATNRGVQRGSGGVGGKTERNQG